MEIDFSKKLLDDSTSVDFRLYGSKTITDDADHIKKYGDGIYKKDKYYVMLGNSLVPLLRKSSLFEKTESTLKINTTQNMI